MPKPKTHKQLAKILKIRPGGTITHGRAGSRHNTGKKSMNVNRKKRKGTQISKSYRKNSKV